MPLDLSSSKAGSKSSCFSSLVLAYFLFTICLGLVVEADHSSTSIGAIIDEDSRVGKEQKTAMIMAVQNFNQNSINHRLKIYFRKTSKDPVQTLSTAEELIGRRKVQVIIGTRTWEEAALAADVGKQAQVPVLSLAAAPSTLPSTQNRWPFLVQMATDSLEQMNCIAAIVNSYHWREVIVIHEDNSYFAISGLRTTLSRALRNVSASIEYDMVLPPFHSLSDPKKCVRQEAAKLKTKQSRVFIVLQSSLPLATHLFREAKEMGLMGRDSVWILTDSISDLLDSVDPSFISSMEGAIGIKSYYSESNKDFLELKDQFRKNFTWAYPEEKNLDPGIHALKAYDSITVIAEAVKELGKNNTSNPKLLLNGIQSSNFIGLSGEIRFHGGKLERKSTFKIVNIVGTAYKELGIWSSKSGFSESRVEEMGSGVIGVDSINEFLGAVNWPGKLERVPKGWAMPDAAAPMIIGVPEDHSPFTYWVEESERFDGFCIKLFEEVVKVLNTSYTLHYRFVRFNGTHNELIANVSHKIFGAAVGDVTILAERSRSVEFTQPFMESDLQMLVPLKSEPQRALMFVKPFTRNMWMITFAILFYTMFVVWFMEHQTNLEFNKGTWKDQLGTVMWFTFSTLFFAHRKYSVEKKIKSNYTKLVVVVWLFVVFVLTSSYKASLTSMLTVSRLEPSVTGLDWIKSTNASVGCDNASFIEDYLSDVLGLKNITPISGHNNFVDKFKSKQISAAFLDLPHQKIFLNAHCKDYTVTGPTYSFGGLGFVFQKGSPIARDVSEAILTLMENGTFKDLKRKFKLGFSDSCSNSETETLGLKNFWVMFLVSVAISTLCFFIFVLQLSKKKSKDSQVHAYDIAQNVEGSPSTMASLAQFFHGERPNPLVRSSTFT